MRRVLAACWGTDASEWAGRRVTLYCDPEVMFGKDKVGGTRISHLSNIDKPKSIPLLVSRGKSATFRVQPLAEPTGVPDDGTQTRLENLRAEWMTASDDRKAEIEAEVSKLSGGAQ